MRPVVDELDDAWTRLDRSLLAAVDEFERNLPSDGLPPLQGLVISPERCRAALQPRAISPVADGAGDASRWWVPAEGGPGASLIKRFGLQRIDLDLLLLALAPDLQPRYAQALAYLQDDVQRRRPCIGLALQLLGDGRALRQRLSDDAPLLHHGLLQRVPAGPDHAAPGWLSHVLQPDESLVLSLSGVHALPPSLTVWARRVQATAPPDPALDAALAHVHALGEPMPRLWLSGDRGRCLQLADRLATAAQRELLLARAPVPAAEDTRTVLRALARHAALHDQLLLLDDAAAWLGDGDRTWSCLRVAPAVVMCGGTQAMPAKLRGYAVPVHLNVPDATERRRLWIQGLGPIAADLVHDIDRVAHLFRLDTEQIQSASADVRLRGGARPSASLLADAARAQTGEALALLADRLDPRADWQDLVLADDALAQLHELCGRVRHRDRVMDTWGFGARLARGRGVIALFSGASGTGKTMAAEVLARTLGLGIYCIDLARVVDKYIGESEKNLDRVFSAAQGSNAVLFFDEADALFGRRTDVHDAHDRYANLQVAYLLQRLESYDGLAVLATNLAEQIDEAFTRRFAVHVHFEFPDEAARLRLWQNAWPTATPVAGDVDRALLARELRLAGGAITSVALASAHLAAADDGPVQLRHVLHAARRELAKGGNSVGLPAALRMREGGA